MWGYVLIILSAFGFGLIPILAIYAYDSNVSLTTLLFSRFTLTSFTFFSYLFVKKVSLKITKKQLLSFFFLGGVLYTLQSTFYFSAVKYIPASLAALLLYLYPIFVAILSFFINHEKLSKKIIFSILLSFFGILLVLGSPNGDINILGVLLATGAAVIYSIYIIISNSITQKVSPLVMSAYISLFAAISFLFGGLYSNSLSFQFDPIGWLPIIGVAIFSGILAMATFFAGMKIIGPTKASILSMIEPVVTIFFSALLLQEKMSVIQAIGGLIVLLGAILVILAREKTKLTSSVSQ